MNSLLMRKSEIGDLVNYKFMCGTLLCLAFFRCPKMSDTVPSNSPAAYKNISPAKKIRSLSRLIKFQKRKLINLENLSLPPKKSLKILRKSPVTLTNYPACQVCHQTKCQYDDTHIIGLFFYLCPIHE